MSPRRIDELQYDFRPEFRTLDWGLAMRSCRILLLALIATLGHRHALAFAPADQSLELTQGWALVSANSVSDGGAVISQPGYAVAGWHPVTLPSTVMAALVADGTYTNLFNDTN